MQCHQACWEDDENNRKVELLVEYRVEDGRPSVEKVTPQSVTFLNPSTKQPTRTVRVWTETGRKILTRSYIERVGLEHLEDAALASAT